jgi:hypothetical protein
MDITTPALGGVCVTGADLSSLPFFPNERRSVVILSAEGAKELLFQEADVVAAVEAYQQIPRYARLRRASLGMTSALAR